MSIMLPPALVSVALLVWGEWVTLLLLILSGDIESNPGPVGKISGLLYVIWLCMLKVPLHHMCISYV